MALLSLITVQQYIDLFALGALLYLFKRIFRPYKCSCGRSIWTGHGILRHLTVKHLYVDPRAKK